MNVYCNFTEFDGGMREDMRGFFCCISEVLIFLEQVLHEKMGKNFYKKTIQMCSTL